MSQYVMGIDVGSTYIKGIVVDPNGSQVAIARVDTPWQARPLGRTEMDAAALDGAVRTILDDVAAQLVAHEPDARIAAIGVSGMAESGVLVTEEEPPSPVDAVVRPIVAWFDPRGDEALASVSDDVSRDFGGRTGLPFTPLATFGKLLTHRAEGLDLSGLQWLNVPEFVAHTLGGSRRGETSLVSRTGLIDQGTGDAWGAALDELGVGRSFLPPRLAAGSSWGTVRGDVPEPVVGARITVAGHDHLVASVAAGAVSPETMYDSIGTAEALVRVLDHPLDRAARASLAEHGIDTVRHMLPGRSVLLAGTRSGLLMRRVLQLAGIHDAAGRARLDDAVMSLSEAPAGLRVTGGDNADGVLTVHASSDGLSPAALFAAALRHSTELVHDVVARMNAEVPPATSTIVAGGWAQMASVQRERLAALPGVIFSDHQEDTAFGAALVAAFCADDSATDLTDFAAKFCANTPTQEGSPV
jgi:sugar (pentulose or hexulose) kinase